MTPALRRSVDRLGRYLRGRIRWPYGARSTESAAAMHHRHIPPPEVEIANQASEELAKSARHLSDISAKITQATDPDDPESFEATMRRMLGRIQ